MTTLNLPAPVWIDTDAALADACKTWAGEECLALDTEFVRTTTFYPRPGLIQVATLDTCWLIDPLTISDWEPFNAILTAAGIVKIFHACAEDLEVCRRLCGVVPEPLFDTQLAMAFVGEGGSVGFQRAVAGLLNVEIPKEATRSDWLQRPLTDEQVDYATADVYYLRRLYPGLAERLHSAGRMSWVVEDCQRITEAARTAEDDLSNSFRRVKLAWKLRPQEQHILQRLSLWREHEARRLDVPRNKVADDQALWNIARYKPRNRDQLHKAGLRPNVIRDSGKDILAMVAGALEDTDSVWPELVNRPLSIAAGNVMKALKARVAARAEALAIPPDLLANKRLTEALVRSRGSDLSGPVSGWRMDVIGKELIEVLASGDTTGDENDQDTL